MKEKMSLIRDEVLAYHIKWFCLPTRILMHPKFQYELFKESFSHLSSLSDYNTISVDGATMKVYRSQDIPENEVKVF